MSEREPSSAEGSTPPSKPPVPTPPANPWPRVVLWVSIVAMFLAAGLYVFRTVVRLPGDAAEAGGRLLSQMAEVAAGFHEGEIETRFTSYAATVSGTSFFQFATLEQMEVYTREDSSSVLWGRFALPDVVVAATAPVEYTYYLDFDEAWRFDLEGDRITVHTPEIRHNRPSIDASAIHFDVRASSVFRDEELAIAELKGELTTLSEGRAKEHVDLVREIGRRKVETFVETWLAGQFGDADDYRVEVVFPDESEATPSSPRPIG